MWRPGLFYFGSIVEGDFTKNPFWKKGHGNKHNCLEKTPWKQTQLSGKKDDN